MTDDTLTRVRAALARLAEVEARATPGPWECSHGGYIGTAGTASGPHVLTGYEFDIDDADAAAIVALRNAAGPLLALAEAVVRFVGGRMEEATVDAVAQEWPWWGFLHCEGPTPYWRTCSECLGEGPEEKGAWNNVAHAPDCPVFAIDAALAALADAPGEVQP